MAQAGSTGAVATPKPAQRSHHVGILAVKAGRTFRGARQAWYEVLLAHNGQQASAYLQATAATPPSLPKSGVAEAPSGWLNWFVRNGVCTVTPQA